MSKSWEITDDLFLAAVRVTTGKKHKVVCYDCYVDNEEKPGHYHLHMDNRCDFYGLIHECLHLVHRIFRDRSITPDEELLAYYQTWWVKQIWRRVG